MVHMLFTFGMHEFAGHLSCWVTLFVWSQSMIYRQRGYKFISWECMYAQSILCSLPPALWQERGVLGVEKTGDSLIISCSRSSQGVGGLGVWWIFQTVSMLCLGGPQGLGKAGGWVVGIR